MLGLSLLTLPFARASWEGEEETLPNAPSFLSCEGSGYSSAWHDLKEIIQESVGGPTPLRMIISSGNRTLLQAVADQTETCLSMTTKFAESWGRAYFPLRDAALQQDLDRSQPILDTIVSENGLGFLREWLGISGQRVVPDAEPFCLCGCVAVFWLFGVAEQDFGGANSKFLLQYARILLGVIAPWSGDFPYRWGDAFIPAFGRWGGWERPTPEEVCQGLPFHNDRTCPLWSANAEECRKSELKDSTTVPNWMAHELAQHDVVPGWSGIADNILGVQSDQVQMLSAATLALHTTRQPLTALSLVRLLQPCDPLWEKCWATDRAVRPSESHLTLRITMIGHHAPGCLSLASVLQAVAQKHGHDLDVTYAGAFYLCQALRGVASSLGGQGTSTSGADPCSDDLVKKFVKLFLSGPQMTDAFAAEAGSIEESAIRLQHALRDVPGLSERSKLVVCVDHVLFCWLLRRRAPKPLLSPMMIVLGMAFFEDVPRPWWDELSADVFAWFSPSWSWPSWQHTDAQAQNQDMLLTAHQHMVLQTFWQFGLQIPWIDTPGVAYLSKVTHVPRAIDSSPSLLVLRSAFWRLPAGVILRSLVQHLLGEKAHWMESFLHGSLGQEALESSWEKWETLAEYSAALYVPSELFQLRFRDMYSMGVPLLAPGMSWALRMLREMFRMWGMLHTDLGHRLPACSAGQTPPGSKGAWCIEPGRRHEADVWPFGSPFVDLDLDPPAKLAFYYGLSDVQRYPHVLNFDSLSGLYDQLYVAHRSGRALGELMRNHFRTKVLGNSLRFCQLALHRLIPEFTP